MINVDHVTQDSKSTYIPSKKKKRIVAINKIKFHQPTISSINFVFEFGIITSKLIIWLRFMIVLAHGLLYKLFAYAHIHLYSP